MGAKERRAREKAAVREAILDAAIELAITGRWEDVTIRAVSARIEYSLTIIYQHFDSKDGIRLGLLRRGFAQLGQALEAADPRDAPPAERITTLARAYFEFGTGNQGPLPDHARALRGTVRRGAGPPRSTRLLRRA